MDHAERELESLGTFEVMPDCVKLCASQPAMLQDSLRPSDADGVHFLEATSLDVFESFVSSLQEGVFQTMLKSEDFRRNLIRLRQLQNRFEDVCELIRSGDFLNGGTDLIKIWDSAHYALWEKEHKKPLTALRRFRIRKRNPLPPSIAKYGRRKLDANAKAFLMHWYNDNSSKPYPGQKERDEISQKTGLANVQIKTWFANARRRERKKKCPLYLARQAAREKGQKMKCLVEISANTNATSTELENSVMQADRGSLMTNILSSSVHLPAFLQPTGENSYDGLRGLMRMSDCHLSSYSLGQPVTQLSTKMLLLTFPNSATPQTHGFHDPKSSPFQEDHQNISDSLRAGSTYGMSKHLSYRKCRVHSLLGDRGAEKAGYYDGRQFVFSSPTPSTIPFYPSLPWSRMSSGQELQPPLPVLQSWAAPQVSQPSRSLLLFSAASNVHSNDPILQENLSDEGFRCHIWKPGGSKMTGTHTYPTFSSSLVSEYGARFEPQCTSSDPISPTILPSLFSSVLSPTVATSIQSTASTTRPITDNFPGNTLCSFPRPFKDSLLMDGSKHLWNQGPALFGDPKLETAIHSKPQRGQNSDGQLLDPLDLTTRRQPKDCFRQETSATAESFLFNSCDQETQMIMAATVLTGMAGNNQQ